MNVYAVRWVERGAGPVQYDPHEREERSTDLCGIDFITCDTAQRAHHYVRLARPNAVVERPRVMGVAEL